MTNDNIPGLNYSELFTQLNQQSFLKAWQHPLQEQLKTALASKHWASMPSWPELKQAINTSLNNVTKTVSVTDTIKPLDLLNHSAVGGICDDSDDRGESSESGVNVIDNIIDGVGFSESQRQLLLETLKTLKPWRKGPFNLLGIDIDTEWRSDWKWARIAPHIDCQDKRILDVGCGNGYYLWRMLGAGARLAMGVDPSVRYVLQWQTIRHCLEERQRLHGKPNSIDRAFVLPIGAEHIPENLAAFDLTFSMGVFYHRKSPIDHLIQMRNTLRPGGKLVLETLIVDGDQQTVLVPDDRYAQMPNVWFIPSVAALTQWLSRCKFKNIQCVDITATTTNEQRATEWIDTHSLPDFLDPDNQNLTIEGLPAPKRAVIIAER